MIWCCWSRVSTRCAWPSSSRSSRMRSAWIRSVPPRGRDAVGSDRDALEAGGARVATFVTCSARLAPASSEPAGSHHTEWILLTSGTTGVPKLVVHTLASLAGPIDGDRLLTVPAVWSTFYDIRRYGGLQILLRALLGGGLLVLSRDPESTADLLILA